jgi:hypothetical protein
MAAIPTSFVQTLTLIASPFSLSFSVLIGRFIRHETMSSLNSADLEARQIIPGSSLSLTAVFSVKLHHELERHSFLVHFLHR